MIRLFVCIPGDNFSGAFLDCWTGFLSSLQNSGEYSVTVSRHYAPVVANARLWCLGGDPSAGERQAPFRGMPYDYILWIDSDMVWTFEDFQRLHRRAVAHDLPCVMTGLYLTRNGREFAAVEDWTDDNSDGSGRRKLMTPTDIEGAHGLIKIAYNGLGFALIPRGVYEVLPYPWFESRRDGEALISLSEDVSFCMDCHEAGVPVFADPLCIVGHEKRVVLKPQYL